MTTVIIVFLLAVAVLLALAVAYGGPAQPPAVASINEPFQHVDYTRLPPVSTWRAEDGAALAYRRWDPVPSTSPDAADRAAPGSVVLVHGSSADSRSLHPLAQALAAAGLTVYGLDVRGHGGSGPRGHLDRVGRLESDLETFMGTVRPSGPVTLAGFSSGGGFVLRIAASSLRDQFTSYLLLAPFISQDAPTYRPDSGGWVRVGIPRIIALTVLNAAGVRRFNHLPVTRFALSDAARELLTPAYDFSLAQNFRPQPDYMANLRAVDRPCAVVVGSADEAFHADRFEPLVRSAGQRWPVQVVPGVGHIGLTLEAAALDAIVAQVRALQAPDGR